MHEGLLHNIPILAYMSLKLNANRDTSPMNRFSVSSNDLSSTGESEWIIPVSGGEQTESCSCFLLLIDSYHDYGLNGYSSRASLYVWDLSLAGVWPAEFPLRGHSRSYESLKRLSPSPPTSCSCVEAIYMQIPNQSIFSLSPALSLSPGMQIMLMPTFKRQAGGTKNKAASQIQDKGEHLHTRTEEGVDTSLC